MARGFVAMVAMVMMVGCGTDQDPGLDPRPDAPATTSVTLAPCPSGGPDATTPAAGCLDPDGAVVRPGG